ncbi:MAG: hypothetical protein E7673_07075 [Ruminococcaceae bacterium]|nr:hypothetical protein [Oscillospiraceae bacterium]
MDINEAIIKITAAINNLLKSENTVTVAIDGGAATGKSTLAKALSERLPANLFHTDDFFLRPEQRTKQRLDEIGGNMDRERFFTEVIYGIKSNKPFTYRKYCCKNGEFSAPISVSPKPISIIEGAYSLHPDLRESYDLKIFLKAPFELRRERIIHRAPDKSELFFDTWIPMENAYFEKYNPEDISDIIIEF